MSRAINARWTGLLTACIFGAGVFCLGMIGDWFLMQADNKPLVAVVDDLLIGVAAGLLVWGYERRRVQMLARKLDTIRETNHHIRNQLQIIEYSAYSAQDRELFTRLHEAVGRIDWALREIVGKQ